MLAPAREAKKGPRLTYTQNEKKKKAKEGKEEAKGDKVAFLKKRQTSLFSS